MPANSRWDLIQRLKCKWCNIFRPVAIIGNGMSADEKFADQKKNMNVYQSTKKDKIKIVRYNQ